METAEATIAKLTEMRRAVEAADDAWFDALKAGATGKDEKAICNAAKAQYRAFERGLIAESFMVTCGRCGGDGVVDFGNVTFNTRSGPQRLCFLCGGAKKMPLKPHKFSTQAPTRLKRVLAHDAKLSTEAEEDAARWAKFEGEHPEVAAFLAPYARPEDDYAADRNDDFLCSMRESARKWGSLTEKQMAAVVRSMERAEVKANATPFPGGTHLVEGEIVSFADSRAYMGGRKMNMIVALTGEYVGNKIMGTIPEKVWDAMRDEENQRTAKLIGSRVRFSAQMTCGDRDPHFGFFKSPKQVEVLHVNWEEGD